MYFSLQKWYVTVKNHDTNYFTNMQGLNLETVNTGKEQAKGEEKCEEW